MESKLKALKVAELKDILAKANEKPAAKATKADLIARILASPAALDAFAKENGGAVASSAEQAPEPEIPAAAPVEPVTPAPAAAPAGTASKAEAPAATSTAAESAPAAATLDEEAEKRKKRSERFGIPFIENPVVPDGKRGRRGRGRGAKGGDAKPADQDAEKLNARAERFGTSNAAAAAAPASSGKKRKSPAPVDPEEEEKRRKRAERFGMPVAGAKA